MTIHLPDMMSTLVGNWPARYFLVAYLIFMFVELYSHYGRTKFHYALNKHETLISKWNKNN